MSRESVADELVRLARELRQPTDTQLRNLQRAATGPVSWELVEMTMKRSWHSSMKKLVKKGWVEPLPNGSYRITPAGLVRLG